MNNLTKYREDKSLWKNVAFFAAEDEKHGTYDANEQERYKLLLELQYDTQKTDIELIRFLFEQEVIARENHSFQGIGEVLELASFLLVRFKKTKDIPLFVKAKKANFDTACGFSLNYIFAAKREATEEYIKANFPEIIEVIEVHLDDLSFPENFDRWWNARIRSYPTSEEKEDVFTLYLRSLSFDEKEKAIQYLEKWIEKEPDSDDKFCTMKSEYEHLGFHSKACKAAEKRLEFCEDTWDKVSRLRDLVVLYIKTELFDKSFSIVKQIDEIFTSWDEWIGVGLGRDAIHQIFELAGKHPNINSAKEAFTIADNHFTTSKDIAYVGLEAAEKAAKHCKLKEMQKKYKLLAEKEKKRIENI